MTIAIGAKPISKIEQLKGLIELFDDKVWARELIASAKIKLSAIENARD